MRRRHRHAFFGESMSTPIAVLTPIAAIYDEFGIGGPIRGGWWPCKVLDDETMIVLTPQGAPVIDALCALEPNVRVIFIGLAGALSALSPGDIVEPSVATLAHSRHPRTSLTPPSYADARVATVTSLNESLQRRHLLRARADCVDMETAWLFATAQRQSREVRAILVVSDHLFGSTFVETQIAVFRAAIQRVTHDILKDTGLVNAQAQPEFDL
jgi:hypothetical protein